MGVTSIRSQSGQSPERVDDFWPRDNKGKSPYKFPDTQIPREAEKGDTRLPNCSHANENAGKKWTIFARFSGEAVGAAFC